MVLRAGANSATRRGTAEGSQATIAVMIDDLWLRWLVTALFLVSAAECGIALARGEHRRADVVDALDGEAGDDLTAERGSDAGDAGQGEQRPDAGRDRRTALGRQAGGRELGEVAPFGEQDEAEAAEDRRPHGRARDDLGVGVLLLGVPGGAEQEDGADREQGGDDDLHERLGKQADGAPGGDGHDDVNGERAHGAEPDPARTAVARHEDDRCDHRLVGEFGGEDGGEGLEQVLDGHRSSVGFGSRPSEADSSGRNDSGRSAEGLARLLAQAPPTGSDDERSAGQCVDRRIGGYSPSVRRDATKPWRGPVRVTRLNDDRVVDVGRR